MDLAEAAQIAQQASKKAQERRAELTRREAERDMQLSGDEWEYGWQQPATGIVVTDEARGRILGWPPVRRRVSAWEPAPDVSPTLSRED